MSVLVDRAVRGDDTAVAALVQVASRDWEALDPYLVRLLDAGVCHPDNHILYGCAGEGFKRRLVELVESGICPLPSAEAVYLLAQVSESPDDVVRDAFRRWMIDPPMALGISAWTLADVLRSHSWERAWLAEIVGSEVVWEIPESLQGRHGGVALPLVGRESLESTVREEHCRWCSSPLWPALDVDTESAAVAAAIAHTGWRGRLRLATCALCSSDVAMVVYTEVAPDGTWAWSGHNSTDLLLWEPVPRPQDPPALCFSTAGTDFCATPFDADPWTVNGSVLGGAPSWIQDDDTPDCPACGDPMPYLGMVSSVDADPRTEGGYYFFLDSGCGLAATVHQQS
ncbi:hypothetical protein ACFVMC_29470 [Nocardia sp. NPDC127579]|uniref:hypothetical protein n=1 Tax=Nocardia sp. NPDC127579 TaxID=3345402 RepID=UPI00363F9B6E